MRKNKKGFTLIELIAVLVIMAILALIVTPLVMNIVKKAKDSANKRSVDAYGKAVELAVATHLLDYGDYPTSLDNLTVEYTGNEVICNVKTLNEDGSIYLSECSVKGTEVKDSSTEDGWYHYGKLISNEITYQAYAIGDTVTYNGMNFYVIEDSDSTSDRVTMLKAEPLTVDEVNTYGVGHVNVNVDPSIISYQTARDINGYGGIAYYTSEKCGYDADENYSTEGCTTDYAQSEVKLVVDTWSNDKLKVSDLTEDSMGYKTRLLTFEDLTNNLGYGDNGQGTIQISQNGNTPTWTYSSSYSYWTMSVYEDSKFEVWGLSSDGLSTPYDGQGILSSAYVVRPVVTILKSAI